ncbi:MAG: prenyltransferase/squalene oxidase repeat-containing protein [Anaerolineae bacterium]
MLPLTKASPRPLAAALSVAMAVAVASIAGVALASMALAPAARARLADTTEAAPAGVAPLPADKTDVRGTGLAQSTALVDLVVDFDDGRVETRRIAVDADDTGIAVLEAAGLELVAQGELVCAIGGVGCPANDCFCEPDRFWAYYHLDDDRSWQFSELGAATYLVGDGDVEGWVWSASRAPITTTAAARSVAVGYTWLSSQMLPDGSIAGHAGITSDAVIAARVAGATFAGGTSAVAATSNATAGDAAARSMVAFLRSEADTYSAEGAAQAGKLAVAAAAANERPARFGGVDLVERIESSFDPATGSYGASTWDQAWSVLGLVAAGRSLPQGAVAALVGSATPDGGWGVSGGVEPDADSTGLALQALVAAGVPITNTAVAGGLAFLKELQNDDGGWGSGPPSDPQPSNANSTALVIQGLLAAGEDPTGDRWASVDGRTSPLDLLRELQKPDGRFEHDESPADLMATVQALPAVARRPLPLPSRAVAVDRAVAWMSGQRSADGGFEGYNPGATLDAVLALTAAGLAPDDVGRGAHPSLTDYLAGQAAEYAALGPSAAGKLATAVVALGADPRDFGGVDVVGAISETYVADGRFGAGGTWDNAWAMIGLAAAGEPVPATAVDVLESASADGGGWGFEADADAPTADSTGLALQALAAAASAQPAAVGEQLAAAGGRAAAPDGNHVSSKYSPAVTAGVDALRALQLPDAGFTGFGGAASVSSTADAVLGLVAVGQCPTCPGWLSSAAGPADTAMLGPIDSLTAAQSPNGGFAGYSGPNDPAATYQAVAGLLARPWPLRNERLFVPVAARGSSPE